jgi:hypothetical protein
LGLSAIAAVLLVRGGVSRFGGRRLAAVVLVLLVGLAVMIGVGIQWGGIDREIVTEAYKSLGYRLQYWQATMGIIADHPWFGCGPGNFQHVYTQYKLPTASEEIADPHNFLLHFWSIAGTPAALAMVVFLVLLVRVAVRGHGKPTRAEAAFGNASSAPPRETVAASRLAPLSGWMVATGAGFFLAVMLSQSASVPLGIEVIMIGMPVAWSAFWLLWPVVRDLEIPPWMLLVAVLALFVNLSAAGGIHFPNVAISAWLLAAMVVFAASRRPPGDATSTTTSGDQVPEPERDRRQGRNLVVTLIGMMVLGAVFYHYEFYPVLKWRACQNAAMRTPDAKERWTYLLQAVKADPWATETWLTLATMMPSTEGGGPEAAEPRTYRRRALMTAPYSAHVRLQLGEAAMQYYSRTGDRETLALAERMFTEAIERYPTNAALHAKKAVAQYLLGKKSAARAAREKAWELDERTPHADQKLTPPLRRQLESLELGDRAAGEAEREAG